MGVERFSHGIFLVSVVIHVLGLKVRAAGDLGGRRTIHQCTKSRYAVVSCSSCNQTCNAEAHTVPNLDYLVYKIWHTGTIEPT